MVKNLPAMRKTWVQSLGWQDPLEKEMAALSSILAWDFHAQRSLEFYSHGITDSWTWLTFTFTSGYININNCTYKQSKYICRTQSVLLCYLSLSMKNNVQIPTHNASSLSCVCTICCYMSFSYLKRIILYFFNLEDFIWKHRFLFFFFFFAFGVGHIWLHLTCLLLLL